jgi:CubicO group peptidase (beta-lactamase class C family)
VDINKIILEAREVIQTEWVAKVPGLCVAVMVGDSMVWEQAFGYADLENKISATTTTRFRVGSVSKPLAAAGLALLVERGLLDLDAPIQKYIPDFPKTDGIITPRLLAGHLTGIRNYRGVEAVSNKPFPDLRSGLKIFENDPLEAQPGTKFSYASYNWNVLGVVMESVTRQNFLTFMDENVIKLLGLKNTCPDLAGVDDPQRTQFYEVNTNGKFFASPKVDLSYAWPSGGYLSTAEDLVHFGAAHFRAGFLKPESIKLLFTAQETADGQPTPYGIGWFVGRHAFHHGGDSFGGTAVLLLLPAFRITVAIVSNGGLGVLRAAMRQGRAEKESQQFLFNKEMIAAKIAGIFAAGIKSKRVG